MTQDSRLISIVHFCLFFSFGFRSIFLVHLVYYTRYLVGKTMTAGFPLAI